jgi:hypothetical protein
VDTLYCNKHDRYHRADTGCLLCRMANGDNYVNPDIPVKEINVKTEKCPSCGRETLAWNTVINMYECSNDACKRRLSRFTKIGLGELLKDTPKVRENPKIYNDDAPVVISNISNNPLKHLQMIDEDDGSDTDIVPPFAVEYAGYDKNSYQGRNTQVVTIKAFLILLAFTCLGFAIWTGYLLYMVKIGQLEGIILLMLVFGTLIWDVYAIMTYKVLNYKLVGLVLIIVLAGLAIGAFAGVEPFSSVKDSIIGSLS